MTKHRRIIAAIALITLTAVALTGCLVKKKEPEPPYYRKSDNLRVYKQGDWILYNVFITTLTGSGESYDNGRLKVSWGNYSLPSSPDSNASNGGNPYDVIEKRYLFCQGDAYCALDDTRVIQYVHQDDPKTDSNITSATAGTERLVAMGNNPTPNQYYWVSPGGSSFYSSSGIPGGQEPVITLKSPLVITDDYTVQYYLMDDCYPGPGCQSDAGIFTNSIKVVGDGTQINTNIGNYADPIEINFKGGVTAFTDPLPVTFDIFDLCSNSTSTHSGRMYIIPEIGAIQMKITCIDTQGNTTSYDITVDSISSSILAGS